MKAAAYPTRATSAIAAIAARLRRLIAQIAATSRASSSVPQLGYHREVVGAPHAVDGDVSGDMSGEHVADPAELGMADHHVVDAAVEVEIRRREGIVVRPRVARLGVPGGLPGV